MNIYERDIPKWCMGERGNLFIDTLVKETERGQVLIAAAFLNKSMKELLHIKFKKEGVSKELLRKLIMDDRSLLFTFGAKIMACRAFGLIRDEDYRALDSVRAIRNDFAHSDFQITLSDPKVTKEINILKSYLHIAETSEICVDQAGNKTIGWRADLLLRGINPIEPLSQNHVFMGAVMMLYFSISIAHHNTESGEDVLKLELFYDHSSPEKP